MKHRLMTVVLVACVLVSCKDSSTDPESAPGGITDAELLAWQAVPTGWTYYKFSADTLTKAGNSAHPAARLFVRYNAKAATQLDGNGKVKAAASFPDSSFIVKELFNGSTRTAFAFMYKLRGNPHADANGWVWSEPNDDGSVIVSAGSKGVGCIGCHSTGSGVDYTRMNDAHP